MNESRRAQQTDNLLPSAVAYIDVVPLVVLGDGYAKCILLMQLFTPLIIFIVLKFPFKGMYSWPIKTPFKLTAAVGFELIFWKVQ